MYTLIWLKIASCTFTSNRQEKDNAGNVTQKIHPSLKQSTLIRTQTHTYRQSYINLLKMHVRHTLNKGEDNGTALARSVVVIYHWGLGFHALSPLKIEKCFLSFGEVKISLCKLMQNHKILHSVVWLSRRSALFLMITEIMYFLNA